MDRFWAAEPEWLVLWFAVLAVALAVAYYVIDKVRPKPAQKEPRASEWLSKYRDLHAQGKISDEEFRTIKTKLTAELQQELKNTGKPD